MQTPQAPKRPKTLTTHQHTREDEFYGLRDDERKDEAILKYLREENAFLEENLKRTDPLRETLFQEIKGRIKEKDLSVPYFDDDFWYYVRYEESMEYPIYCRKKGSLEASEEILLDANEEAKKYKYYQVGQIDVTDDGQWLAFSEDVIGRRQYRIRFMRLGEKRELLPHVLDEANGDLTWAGDNATLFYTVYDPDTLRGCKIFKFNLLKNEQGRSLVYHETDESYYTGISRSKSKQFLTIHLSSTTTTETLLIPANSPESEPVPFCPRQREHEYSVFHYPGEFFILTNWEAKNFRLMRVPEAQHADRNQWEELIPARENVFLEGLTVLDKFLVFEEREDGLLKLRVQSRTDGSEYFIPFDDPAYSAHAGINLDFSAHTLRYSYTSLRQPYQVLEFDLISKKKKILKEQEVVGGHDAEAYESKRLWATGEDGTKIPISLVYKKGYAKDGTMPLYTYAYGSYGISSDPGFSSTRLSLLDRGFAFAIFHVRGGEELGRKWYEDGRQLKKWNTFRDFVACTRYLHRLGYGSPANTVAMGGSAGGLLMGVLANEAPQHYQAIVAHVPFVDVVTTMLDASIPLTTNEYDEWGNPENTEFYNYMLSYSPYDNVRRGEYPHMLVTSGLHDSQVQYWEPTKWVACLRESKTDENLLLLHTNMEAGHGGASGRFQRLKEVAMEYAFILKVLGKA